MLKIVVAVKHDLCRTPIYDIKRGWGRNKNLQIFGLVTKSKTTFIFPNFTLCKFILIQIRRLLQDRSNLDKELIRTQQELTKVEGKLQNVVREKSALATQVASLEKDLMDIKKSKEVLKTKV